MKTYLLAPLLLSSLCLLYVFVANRRPRLSGVLWPQGMTLSGSVKCPDLTYDGDVVLGCTGEFGTIRCRTLRIAVGADVQALAIEAAKVRIDGKLRGVKVLAAGKKVDVRGELYAEDLQCPRVYLRPNSKATVLTVTGNAKVHRDPKADVKGFFVDLDEMLHAGVIRRDRSGAMDTESITTAATTSLQ